LGESSKFICDFMLGRLAKWMRLLGIDTLYYNDPDDPSILHKALKEGRIILTRSGELAKNENAIFIKSEELNEQLKQIKEIISISNPFTRCPICNSKLKTVDREEIKKEVPEYIYEVHNIFKRCSVCARIYWKGTHYEEIKRKIDEIIA